MQWLVNGVMGKMQCCIDEVHVYVAVQVYIHVVPSTTGYTPYQTSNQSRGKRLFSMYMHSVGVTTEQSVPSVDHHFLSVM